MSEKNVLKTYNDFFLSEKLDSSDINVVLLSNFDAESHTANDFDKSFKGKAKNFYPININKAKVKNLKDDSVEITDGEIKANVNSNDTVIITRRGVIKNTRTKNVVEELERNGFFIFNSLNSIMNCECKWSTYKKLKDAGLPTPRTVLLDSDDDIKTAVEEVGGKFPLIIKTLSGSHGIGVSVVDSLESLKSVLQTIWKLKPGSEIIIQEKIDADSDLRVHVLTKKFNHPVSEEDPSNSILLGYMRRNKIDNDFRTNHSLGGTVEKTKVSDEQTELCIKAAKAMGCNWCGVDIIEDTKTGKNYILEVNSSPGTTGLKKATGIDVLGKVANFVLDKDNWISEKHTIGFRELVEIPGIGDIVGKFDTGNGSSASTLHADEFEIDGDFVNWKLGKKKFKNKIIGYTETEIGEKTHKRPIINLNLKFLNKVYHDAMIALEDRSSKSTKLLINRNLMESMGLKVSPSKVFLLTNKPKQYSAASAKGKRYGGIFFK